MDNAKGLARKIEETPSVKKGKNYFLGIGINDYTGGWSRLYNAVRDVERVGQILKEKYDFDILPILTNTQATRPEILRQLRALQNLKEDDSLLIYYSGHGHLAKEDGYWIPVNAHTKDIDDYIPNAQLRGLIKAIPTRHTLLIADSCYSGSFFPESEMKNMRGAADELEKYRSRWAFCSGRHDQKVSDGTAGTHSPFAEALITELERNNRPKVYIQELAIPVINRTAGKYRQTPKANLIFDCGDDGGQFVFALKDNNEKQDFSILQQENIVLSSIGITDVIDLRQEPLMAKVVDPISFEKIKEQTPQYQAPNIILSTPQFDFEPEMVFVEGGIFKREGNQKVKLSSFYIGKYLVTQSEWKAVMGNNPSFFEGDNLPVETVSWKECQKFIKIINDKTHNKYRLPTEAEWEFAARGGNLSKGFAYSGSDNLDEVAWYEENSNDKTHLVGLKKANELGVYDMTGNVWEWCNDWSGEHRNNSIVNPQGAKTGTERVCRGGSYLDVNNYCGVNFSWQNEPIHRENYLGFRLAMSHKEKDTDDTQFFFTFERK